MKDVRCQDTPVVAPHRFVGGVNLPQSGDKPLVAQFLQTQGIIVLGRAVGAGLFRLDNGD